MDTPVAGIKTLSCHIWCRHAPVLLCWNKEAEVRLVCQNQGKWKSCFCTRLKGDPFPIDKAIMEDEENADAFSEASDSPDEGDLEDAPADFPRGLEIEASPSRPQRCPIPSQLLDRNFKSCIEQASECYALGAWI